MLPALTRARSSALAAALTAGVLVPTAFAAPASASVHRTEVPYTTPAWATAAADRGPAAASAVVPFEVGLDLQDEAGAEALAGAVSTPGTAQYGAALSPAAWITRFAPTQASVDATLQQLRAAGLVVTDVPASREYIVGTGTAAQLGGYFHTSLRRYAVGDSTRYAAVTRPSVAGASAAAIAAVDFDRPRFVSRAVPSSTLVPRGTSSVSPCSTSLGAHTVTMPTAYGKKRAGTVLCGYTPKQLRAVYQLDAKGTTHYTGRGQTIAVVDAYASPSMRRDLTTFSSRNHLRPAPYREVLPATQRDQADCIPAAWQMEQTLDLEAAHAVAPAASLLYVGAADCGFGMDVALSRVLDGGLASIVSNSYGALGEDPNADTVMLHQQIQAAGEGIGLYYASGDTGDEAMFTGVPTADFPATSPWVTAVGGTATALTKKGTIAFSTGWGDDVDVSTTGKHPKWQVKLPGLFFEGSGGGRSSLFDAPAYQRGVVPASLSHGRRAESDVAALAAPETGFRIGFRPIGTSRYLTASVGGTSLATPIVAAEIALAQQQGHRVFGFVNPALYRLVQAHPTAVRDDRPSKSRRYLAMRAGKRVFLFTLDRDSSLVLRRGYDEVTGVGELTRSTLSRLAR